ncbi:hypothetical protein CHS0354_025625 [Potamilus streckersoni]|uniref:Uncharacterized protein n=1 Tax=Potamilus streckersoni TaxID=2493646 RepID=A0AAE0S184_9BIVA|nr:hypothetical protein CHS0354_025625 [Potamilus streckersoni]
MINTIFTLAAIASAVIFVAIYLGKRTHRKKKRSQDDKQLLPERHNPNPGREEDMPLLPERHNPNPGREFKQEPNDDVRLVRRNLWGESPDEVL